MTSLSGKRVVAAAEGDEVHALVSGDLRLLQAFKAACGATPEISWVAPDYPVERVTCGSCMNKLQEDDAAFKYNEG